MKLPNPLSHAYLISGGSGQSRAEFARRMAAAYLCEGPDRPCGRCRHCRKVSAGAHPDVITVTVPADKREISVDQARSLRTDAYIRPNEGERKVYVIDPADAMNPVAQNALLKVLEEGPPYAAFLLLAEQPGRLLETIRSRCEGIALPPEEEAPDAALLEKSADLVRVLLHGSELEAAEHLAALEQEKLKSGQMADLLACAERSAAQELIDNPRRSAKLLRALKQCRENAVFNPGAGHVLGWLLTELYG